MYFDYFIPSVRKVTKSNQENQDSSGNQKNVYIMQGHGEIRQGKRQTQQRTLNNQNNNTK